MPASSRSRPATIVTLTKKLFYLAQDMEADPFADDLASPDSTFSSPKQVGRVMRGIRCCSSPDSI
jgi:hypothetical protein